MFFKRKQETEAVDKAEAAQAKVAIKQARTMQKQLEELNAKVLRMTKDVSDV